MDATLLLEPAASSQAVDRLRAKYPQLPESYLGFLRRWNGAHGDLGVQPGWAVVWSAEEALVATSEYQMPEYLPGYFAFGGNGGGELFVFAFAPSNADRQVFMVPAIGMAESERWLVVESFSEFQSQLGKPMREA